MASDIVEHPGSKARRTDAQAAAEAVPPVLQGEVQTAEEAEAELPPPAIERLHALVRKGYRPELGGDTATDIVLLRHVGRAPDLVLHSDGRVEGHDGRRPFYKRDIDAPAPFGAGDLREQLRFMRFLDSVPPATLRDRTRRWRQRYVYFPLVVAILLAIHLAFTAIIMDDGPPQRESTPAEQSAQAAAAEQAARGAGDPAVLEQAGAKDVADAQAAARAAEQAEAERAAAAAKQGPQ